MITLGVDLAAEPQRTAVVRVDWTHGNAAVADAFCGADDEAVIDRASDADKIGIDCPLGWPDAFVDFVAAHRDGAVMIDAATIEARRPLVYRATDRYCRDAHGIRPLSVAADRIAHAALRCAGLLARLGETDRSGVGRVVESYPAGSLEMWGLPHRRYKDDPAKLRQMLETITARVRLEFATGAREVCTVSDHAFDALVAALTARAAALRPPVIPAEFVTRARREGWISLPGPALEALRGSQLTAVPRSVADAPTPESRTRH